MKFSKTSFTITFILITAIFLLSIQQFADSKLMMAFSMIPVLVAYYLGQYSERKFADKK